mgnify:CR=1 FL=1
MINLERKKQTLDRLNRIEGQVRGLKKMVEEERYCLDILTQISSVQEALRGVGKIIMRNYLENCVTASIRSETPEGIYDELMEAIFKFVK